MRIPSNSYKAIHATFNDAIAWMNSLGISITSSRINHYNKILGYWKDAYRTATEEAGIAVFPDFVGTLNEIYEFINIYLAFKDTPRDFIGNLTEKLRNGINGPIFTTHESNKNSSPRNFLFEAAVAARIHRPMRFVTAALDAPTDTGVYVGNKKIWIECKRVISPKKLESNIRDASSQLERALSQKIGTTHRGIVALDISKLITNGGEIFVAKNDSELIIATQNLLDQFIKKNFSVWESVYKRRTNKIIGTLLRVSFMSSSEERGLLTHTTQWAINPSIKARNIDMRILEQLASILDNE